MKEECVMKTFVMRLERIIQKINPNSFGNKLFRKFTQFSFIYDFQDNITDITICSRIIKATDQRQSEAECDLFSFDMTWIADPPQHHFVFCWFTRVSALAIYFLSRQNPIRDSEGLDFFIQSLIYLTSQCIFRFYHCTDRFCICVFVYICIYI